MKKVVTIILFIILVLVSLNVKAVSENGSTVNMSFTQTVNQDSVVITIRLGSFVSVEENSIMAATMTLDFDNNVISRVEGIGGDGWDVTIQESTKRAVIETDTANPNTEVAQIIFHINPDAETTESTVGLKEINIGSSTSGLDENYNDVTVSFTANEEIPTPPAENETPDQNIIDNTVGNNSTTNNVVENTSATNNSSVNNSVANRTNTAGNRDNTTSTNRLPDTGIGNILIIAIVIIAICIIIFKIKSREIKY